MLTAAETGPAFAVDNKNAVVSLGGCIAEPAESAAGSEDGRVGETKQALPKQSSKYHDCCSACGHGQDNCWDGCGPGGSEDCYGMCNFVYSDCIGACYDAYY